jgi:biotin carboxyl carrier protein
LGARVQTDEELGTITDPLVDRIRLADLELERSFAQAESTRAQALVAGALEGISALEARSDAFRTHRVAQIEDRLAHARARLALLEQAGTTASSPPGSESERTADSISGGRDTAEAELAALLDDGQSGAGPEAQTGDLVAPVAVEYAQERVEVLETELRAAREGVFLGDGYNDAPWSEQRAEELRALIRDRRAAQAEAASRLQAVERRIATAQVAVSRLTGASLASTVDGQVWDVRADDGEHVERGQDVVVLLDCGSLVVTLSVTESVFNRLSLGDEARFRLAGDGRDFAATVTRLGGSGALTFYQNLAVAPSAEHLERFDVALLVPELGTTPDLACPVGRTGRAFFERRPLDWLRGL